MISMDNFGAWLINEIETRNWSQSSLARKAGISRGTLSNIISGARGRGPDTLKAISRALKLPHEQVFRAAGLLPPKPDTDPWIEEQAHKLTLIPPGMRKIASKFIDSVISDEEAGEKPKQRKSTSTKSAK